MIFFRPDGPRSVTWSSASLPAWVAERQGGTPPMVVAANVAGLCDDISPAPTRYLIPTDLREEKRCRHAQNTISISMLVHYFS